MPVTASAPSRAAPWRAGQGPPVTGQNVRSDPAAPAAAGPAEPLVAALVAGQPVQDQQDQGADDGADDPGRAKVVDGEGVVLDQVQDEPAEEGPQHAEIRRALGR